MSVQKAWVVAKLIAAAVGAIVAFIAAGLAIYNNFFPATPQQRIELLGRWDSRYHFPIGDVEFNYHGKVEFIRNGRYNVKGLLVYSGKDTNGTAYEYTVSSQGAGNWSADKDFFMFTLIDNHMEITSFKVAGTSVPVSELKKLLGEDVLDLNKKRVSGSSDEYKIISAGKREIIMEGKDPQGHPFKVINSRRDALF